MTSGRELDGQETTRRLGRRLAIRRLLGAAAAACCRVVSCRVQSSRVEHSWCRIQVDLMQRRLVQ